MGGKVKKLFLGAMSGILIITAIICISVRIAQAEIVPSLEIMSAELTMPTGNRKYNREVSEGRLEESSAVLPDTAESSDTENQTIKADSSEISNVQESTAAVVKEVSKAEGKAFEEWAVTEEEIEEYDKSHEGEEQYPVYEFTITEGNESYGNVQIKNTSSTKIDIKKELESELGFSIDKSDEPQVLIYHTHTSESFLKYDTGYFYESFYPRTTDTTQNICAVGEEIAKQLNAAGIKTIHDTTLHDYPSYNGAYDRSYATVMEYLAKYPTIKVTLDIHRDGIGTDTEKTKPVFIAEGKKAAQMMILSGYNYDDSEEFKDWEYNLRFALQIQKTANEMYPDMVRPLNFSDFMYNMNINTGSLLIEMGAESNTIEEVRYTGYLLGKVLTKVLSKR